MSGDKPVTFDELTALTDRLRESDDLAEQRAIARERIARGAAISLDDARRMNAEPQPIAAAAAQLQDGDVAILHYPGHLSDAKAACIKASWDAFWVGRGTAVPCLIFEEGMTLETIPADRLRQLGWVRADALLGDLEDDQR